MFDQVLSLCLWAFFFCCGQSEVEPEHHSSTKYKSSRSDVLDQRKDLRTWTSQHPSIQPPDDSATSLVGSSAQPSVVRNLNV